jgi:hypothetical protein
VLDAHPGAALAAAVVWLPMLGGDDAAAAGAAASLVADPRARHFYDPGRRAGRAVARALGAAGGETAWDMYLFWGPGARWAAEAPPRPEAWLHQLGDCSWADPARHRWGDGLSAALRELAGTHLAPALARPRAEPARPGAPPRRRAAG